MIAQALKDRVARVEFTGIMLRTLDGRIWRLCDDKNAAERIRVESGDAAVLRDPQDGSTYLRYAFDSPSEAPVVLRFEFDSPAPADELHKLLVGWVTDDSWHRLDATLTIGRTTWDTRRTTYAAQNRAGSVILQPPSYEDETFKNRSWVPLEKRDDSRGAGAADGGDGDGNRDTAHKGVLRLILSPSSTLQAIAGKVQFNYSRAFRAVPFWRYVGNSILLVILTTIGTWFSSMFVAYALARLHWPGRTVALVLLLSTMMLPAQVTMIPQFMVWRQLGWYNTLNPLWVPAFFGWAFYVFLMVQQMKTIPRDLEDAARIDGLGALQTWWYVIVPLVKPTSAAIAIMTVMGAWNEFMGPLIYLRDQSRFPLSLGLFAMRIDNATGAQDWTMIMAGNVLMTLPMVVMFVVFQRYFIQGMTMSGLKG
jgi:ABC-type glycerol-3-phosphate transport system permease component